MIEFKNPYWSLATKISYLQRQVIVAGIIYYWMDDSIMSDREYDEISKQLVELQKENEDEFRKSMYYYCMKDFDGSTSFDVKDRLTQKDKEYLTCIALSVLHVRRM